MSFDDHDPPVSSRIPAGLLGNRLFRTQREARQAAVALANQFTRATRLPYRIVHHQARLPGHRSHYHVVDPAGRQISGHFFYGRQPYWTQHRQREMEVSNRRSHAWYGNALERPFLEGWRRDLGSNYQVFLSGEFPAWLQTIFPSRSQPDLVAVDPHRRHILVGDATRYPTPRHIAKTFRDARRVAQNLPPELQNHRVFAQERYWGTDPDIRRMLGLRGNTSRRVEVTRRH